MLFLIRPIHCIRQISASVRLCHRSRLVVLQASSTGAYSCSFRRTMPVLTICDYNLRRCYSKTSTKRQKFEMNGKDVLTEYYNELMTNATRRTADEWSAFGSKFEGSFLKSRWPTVMLNYIIGITETVPGLFEVGMSLIEYAAVGGSRDKSFLLLATVAICVHQGGSCHHDTALSTFKQLSSTIECFDITSINILISALSKTDQWKECLKLIDMVKLSADISLCYLSPLLVAALNHNDAEIFDSVLHLMADTNAVPVDEVYHLMLDLGRCEQLVEILKRFGWVPCRPIANRIATYYESQTTHGTWRKEETKVDTKGKCANCGLRLQPLRTLGFDEFSELRDAFMELSIKRNGNVFLHTTPEELDAYQNFLSHYGAKPFDVVIDGLNIAHVTKQDATKHEKDEVLYKVIKYFHDLDQRILILGREHMRSWNCASFRGVSWFYTSNISADDPYMLYAAMHSGLNTFILSNDMMRDSRFLLGDKLMARFKLWQRLRQIRFRGVWPGDKWGMKSRFLFPSVHDTVVQSTKASLHIPIAEVERQAASKWYCVTRFTADDDDDSREDARRVDSLRQSIYGSTSFPAADD